MGVHVWLGILVAAWFLGASSADEFGSESVSVPLDLRDKVLCIVVLIGIVL